MVFEVKAVLRIHDILVWIRIRRSMPLTNLDPPFFVTDLQEANKKLIFCLLLFEGTLTSFFKDKKSKEK